MFAIIVILLAAVMGILVSTLPQESLANLFYVSRFIEVMIPILGVGALIKYLFSCTKKKSCCCVDKSVCATKTDVKVNPSL